MNLTFDKKVAENYKNISQKVRVMSESWVNDSVFCPNCGNCEIKKYSNNQPVADFFCLKCSEDYELKSKQNSIGTKVIDGAYRTMIERLTRKNNPNLFLLSYDLVKFEVTNFFVIPKYFFVPKIIEKRKPLSATARRAGWIGCNILLNDIPQSGKIYIVKNKQIESRNKILTNWKKTLFLREENNLLEKGWLLDVMQIIENLKSRNFTLQDIYQFEDELKKLHPKNLHIKDKIRQQLQILRDKGYLNFESRGIYSLN